jgi:hypothetical protein
MNIEWDGEEAKWMGGMKRNNRAKNLYSMRYDHDDHYEIERTLKNGLTQTRFLVIMRTRCTDSK